MAFEPSFRILLATDAGFAALGEASLERLVR